MRHSVNARLHAGLLLFLGLAGARASNAAWRITAASGKSQATTWIGDAGAR